MKLKDCVYIMSKYRANFIKSNVFEICSSFQHCAVTMSPASVKCWGNPHPDGGRGILMAEEKLEGTGTPRSN